MVVKNKTVLILTGAGFSVPFLSFNGYHLTTDFLTRLISDEVLLKEMFRLIYGDDDIPDGFLTINSVCKRLLIEVDKNFKEKRALTKPNFETLLYLLEQLVNAQEQSSHRYFETYLEKEMIERSSILNLIFETKAKFRNEQISYDILFYFKEFILDVISKFEAGQDSYKLIAHFISNILKNNYLKYYTLNYDNLIVKSLYYYYEHIGNLEMVKTFNLGNMYSVMGGPIESQYTFKSYHPYTDRKNSLFFLHGCIYFKPSQKTQTINFDDRKFIHPNGRPWLKNFLKSERESFIHSDGNFIFNSSFITGLNKSIKLNDDPYACMFTKFRLDFHEADELIIIGYGFEDEHINAVLTAQSEKLKKITVVDYLPLTSLKEERLSFENRVSVNLIPFGYGRRTPDWNFRDYIKIKNKFESKWRKVEDNKFFKIDLNGAKNFLLENTLNKVPV